MTDVKNPDRKPVLMPGAIVHQAEFARATWHLTVPNEITLPDLLRPDYWQHYPQILQAPALIDVMSEDAALDVQLRVLGSATGAVFVRLRAGFQLRDGEDEEHGPGSTAAIEAELPEGYRVGFSPKTSYYVQLSLGDGAKEIVSKDWPTKVKAEAAALDHARVTGRLTDKAA